MSAPNAAERAAVDAGAALLDEKRPGWWYLIEADEDFRIDSCGRCIAGQIGAHHIDADVDAIDLDLTRRWDFEQAAFRTGLRVLGVDVVDADRYGFDVDDESTKPDLSYDGLTLAWRELIAARRGSHAAVVSG